MEIRFTLRLKVQKDRAALQRQFTGNLHCSHISPSKAGGPNSATSENHLENLFAKIPT